MKEGPDQGRAWLIAFAAFIINMILSGLSRMIAILYVAVIDEYGVSRQEATAPFSVRNSIRCLAGPLVGIVGQRLGIRTTTFCGGVIAALGAALCSVAPTAGWITVFWGGIHGIGFAFANTLFQVVVNQYFEKYRATAFGIAMSGACLGSLAFPFMFEAILERYGLRGAFLILAGIIMNVLPPAIMLQQPPWVKKANKDGPKRTFNKHGGRYSIAERESFQGPPITAEEEEDIKSCRKYRSPSLSNCPTEGMEVLNARRLTITDTTAINQAANNLKRKASSVSRSSQSSQIVCTNFQKSNTPPSSKKSLEKKNSITSNGSQKDAPKIYVVSNTSPNPNGTLNPDGSKQQTQATEEPKKESSILVSIKNVIRLYKSPLYLLISVCNATYVIIFIPILTVIVDYSIDKGLRESDGKYLINAMALGDLIGRVSFGWVTDKGFLTLPSFMSLCLVIQGIIVAVFPFAMSLYSFMGLLFGYSLLAGAELVLFPILVLRYISWDQQPVAIGCVGFISGMISFGTPGIIGHFRDGVGSYDGMFYMNGGLSILTGALWLLEPVMAKIHLKKRDLRNLRQDPANTATNK